MNEEFYNRQQFIRNSNDLNKGVNVNTFIEGNRRKVALDQRLEELSINNNVLLSGNIVRQNVLRASSSKATTLNNVIDTENYRVDKQN